MPTAVIGKAKIIARMKEVLGWLPGLGKTLHGDLAETGKAAVPFASVSTAASGKKFVIKGFDSAGRHVKFSCDWGQLSDGQVYFIPKGGKKWEETTETHIDLDLAAKKLILEFETGDGVDYTAQFWV